MSRTIVAFVVVAVLAVASGQAQQKPSPLADLKTTAEASDFKSTSTHEDVVKFMKAVDDASPIIFYTTDGKTFEGRDMPLAVVGTGLKDFSPAAVDCNWILPLAISRDIPQSRRIRARLYASWIFEMLCCRFQNVRNQVP